MNWMETQFFDPVIREVKAFKKIPRHDFDIPVKWELDGNGPIQPLLVILLLFKCLGREEGQVYKVKIEEDLLG